MSFINDKKQTLLKEDLSQKGSVDVSIQPLVSYINSLDNYYTTSSCSGRITLLEKKSDKKIDSKWLLASHEPVTSEQVQNILLSKSTQVNQGHDVWLMHETFILHVCCKTIEDAESFLKICRIAGLKRSGIISAADKIMIECIGNEKLETIVIKNGIVYCTKEYIQVLIEECNHRMIKNNEKMNQFLKLLQEKLIQ